MIRLQDRLCLLAPQKAYLKPTRDPRVMVICMVDIRPPLSTVSLVIPHCQLVFQLFRSSQTQGNVNYRDGCSQFCKVVIRYPSASFISKMKKNI